ncbi:MAG: aldose 1-epimerase family protein [Paramuribaculum sp.]|nr:aldose 1-epimerase family protein [Paramuribaculum sp.]
MIQTLHNDLLTVTISSHGAELQSIEQNRSHYQYLWQGDKTFWGRRSPVLFPIVGALWQGKFLMDGNEYAMGQHGFARDCDFVPMDGMPDDEAWFMLESNDETLAKYPRRFRLAIGYRLQEARLDVMWRVVNTDSVPMDFQIGAHPAFNYPEFSPSDSVHGYFQMGFTPLTSQIIERQGCIGSETSAVAVDNEYMLPISASTFERDAIILANSQVRRVSMLTKHRTPYLTLLFNAPLVGLWSPKPEAPFVCIEPWWGRADSVGYEGEFAEREWVNHLEPGATFEASYTIIFDDL